MSQRNFFIALWQDHHCDPSVHLFSSSKRAIDWAKAKVREQVVGTRDLNEEMTPGTINAGWLYYGSYGPEGDSIRVLPAALDEAYG